MRRVVDAVIVVALPEESGHLGLLLRDSESMSLGPNLYVKEARLGSSKVIVATLPEYGQVAAAVTSARLLEQIDTSLLAMVGIAGAVHGDCRLTDVIVARTVSPIDLAGRYSETPNDKVFHARYSNIACHPSTLGASIEEILAPVLPTFRAQCERAASAAQLPAWDTLRKVLGDSLPEGAGECPKWGTVASVDYVVDSKVRKSEIGSLPGQILAVEMESGGAAYAARLRGVRYVSIRGISDLADGSKTATERKLAEAGLNPKAVRSYAALNASCLLAILLEAGYFAGDYFEGTTISADVRSEFNERQEATVLVNLSKTQDIEKHEMLDKSESDLLREVVLRMLRETRGDVLIQALIRNVTDLGFDVTKQGLVDDVLDQLVRSGHVVRSGQRLRASLW